MKLVVDTNVLLSGSLWPGKASELLDALLAGEATLCTSEALLAELADVLQRGKSRTRLHESGQNATAILARFREIAQVVEPEPMAVPPALRDPDDVQVLACAAAARASAIVTGDADLLTMKEFAGVSIINISEALRLIRLKPE